ncbi:MAG: hypothetical protein GX606_06180, partial [Elusimicrobia bacterium]|nr:hypothetical protein [Elusimicrobiota bacterium]
LFVVPRGVEAGLRVRRGDPGWDVLSEQLRSTEGLRRAFSGRPELYMTALKAIERFLVFVRDGSAYQLEMDAAEDSSDAWTRGGIDLNDAAMSLQIRRDGNGVALPLEMQDVDSINIDGVIPEILSIEPVSGLPFFKDPGAALSR